MRVLTCMVVVACGVLLTACLHPDSGGSTSVSETAQVSTESANFDPANGVLPFPNNLLFSGTVDGTINIPPGPGGLTPPQVALNALDGFSTVAPITATFSGPIDASSLSAGGNVRVFEVSVDPATLAVTGIIRELAGGIEFTVSLSPVDTTLSTLVISPLQALKPKAGYLVTLIKGIRDTSGGVFNADSTYAIAQSTAPLVDGTGASQTALLTDAEALALEPLRQLTNAQEAALATRGITSASIILSWSFSTQSIGDVLGKVRELAQTAGPSAFSLTDSGTDSPAMAADVFLGTFDVPYYLTAAAGVNDPAPTTTFWTGIGGSNLTRFNTTPVIPPANGTVTIPLIATIPKTPKPAGGWPTVLWQHGITTNRITILAIADALAAAGFAVIGIDLPLHGLTGNETDGSAAFKCPANPLCATATERTFDLDLADNATGAPGPDGITDSSGTHFINLASLLTSRDNLRQGVSDLFTLFQTLPAINVDGMPGGDFDTNNVYLVGHSLGGMVGAVFLALEPGVKSGVLAMPGGGIAKLLDGSANFGPIIAAGLAANGVIKGTPDYEAFLGAAQTVIDSGDALNYASATTTGRGIAMFEVVGGATSLPDQTIPNNVVPPLPAGTVAGTVPSALAGTDPLAAAQGLMQIDSTTAGTDLKVLIRYSVGHHGSILTPNDITGMPDATSAAVFAEMQAQMAGFLASDGTTLPVTDASLLQPTP